MLALAHFCFPGQIAAATVDHGLRSEAMQECALVTRWCEERSIPHRILHPASPITGNIQSTARAARYHLLEGWRSETGQDWLMTAHQADDQIETVIMRLNRGSGVAGLAGVRARRGVILRPLLSVRRSDLRAFCRTQDVPFVDDPSNVDQRFDRVRIRAVLGDQALLDPSGVARSCAALAEAEEAVSWASDQLAERHISRDGDALALDRIDLPLALVRRLLLRMIAQCNDSAEIPRGPSLDQAIIQLFSGKSVTLADCVVSGGSRWVVRRAPPRRSRE